MNPQVRTEDPYFAIHHAVACEEPRGGGGGSDGETIRLYTAAWPVVGAGPFLGDWGGDVPLYDDGKINPTLLLETTLRLREGGASLERSYVAGGAWQSATTPTLVRRRSSQPCV